MWRAKLDSSLVPQLLEENEDKLLQEVGYSKQQMLADLKQMRCWLNDQQHLPPSRLTEPDLLLMTFLNGSKGSLEAAKKKLDSYYSIRSHSELYDCRDPLEPINVSSYCDMAIAPGFGYKNNGILFLGKLCDLNANTFDYLSFARALVYRAEICIRLTKNLCPIYLAFDCKNASPSIVLKIRPLILRDMLFLMQDVWPLRIFRFGFINTPSYIDTIVNTLIRPFLSKKLKERLFATSDDHKDFLNYFSAEALPSDYGGNTSNPTLKELSEKWNRNIELNRDWFMNDLCEHVDETKRIDINNREFDSYFGVHGSLKKLTID